MITPLDALYKCAYERNRFEQWFHDEDIRKDYEDCMEYAEAGRKELLSTLEGRPPLSEFRRYVENQETVSNLWGEVLFKEGLSLGIYLGSLSSRC